MITRRTCLLACAGGPWVDSNAHNQPGRVDPPLPAPPFKVTLHDGRRTTLPALLRGKHSALQVMFTSCSSTCPIQGALFGAVQKRITEIRGAQLISVSIDPLHDDPKVMRAWLQRYGAGPHWFGSSPEAKDIDRWLDFLRARSSGADKHTAQVYFFNARTELVLRSPDFPAADEVIRLLSAMAAR